MEPLRIGLVGAGWIAREHVAALGRIDGASLAAVCDVDEARARELAGSAEVTTDWQELVGRGDLDAVWVCTPPLAHRDPAVGALEAGLPVYLEKPIARSLDDAAAIVAAADQSGLPCAVGYQWHALDVLEDARQALSGQAIGLLAGRSIGPTQARPWFLDRAQGGGNLLERASHHVDLQRALAGEVVRVQAAAAGVPLGGAAEAATDIEDALTLVLQFEGGGLGTIVVAWTRQGMPGIYALEVAAQEATLILDLDPAFTLRGTSRGRSVEASAAVDPLERGVRLFLDAVRTGDPTGVACTPADAARTLAVSIACEQALESGETHDVPALSEVP